MKIDMKLFKLFFRGIALTLPVTALAVSPVHNRVFEFVPAPGQFVNSIPEWTEGDDAQAMAEKAYQYTVEDGSMISLGAWGGYVTVGFEKTIVNVPGKRDIYFEGNSFVAGKVAGQGGSSEPGVIYVSYDINQNGLPDDEWFEIAGSEYKSSIHDYEITYLRPATDMDDIEWTDNKGGSGKVLKNQFHKQPYWPQWLKQDEKLVFKGCRLPDNGINEGTDENPYFVLEQFDYGYADNYPNFSDSEGKIRNEGAMIDIDWAVDENGNAVKMPGVDFVRIQTGVNQYNGWLGENSTELYRAINTHTVINGRDEVVDESVVIDNAVLSEFLSKYGESSVEDVDNENLRIYLNSLGEVVFFLNQSASVRIYDQTGRLCFSDVMNEGEGRVDLSSMQRGLYIVCIDGKTIKVMKK